MWNDLSMADRAKVIKLSIENGITDLATIRKLYDSTTNRHDSGGYIGSEKSPINLKEVTITPKPWQQEFHNQFGNQEIRNAVLKVGEKLGTQNVDRYPKEAPYQDYPTRYAHRMYNVWKEADKPKIFLEGEEPWWRINPMSRSNYDPITNSIIISKRAKGPVSINSDITTELAHPIQEKYGENIGISQYIKDIVPQIKNYFGDVSVYNNPNTIEYETHRKIEPIIRSYTRYNKSPLYRGKSIVGSKVANKFDDGGFKDDNLVYDINPNIQEGDIGQNDISLGRNRYRRPDGSTYTHYTPVTVTPDNEATRAYNRRARLDNTLKTMQSNSEYMSNVYGSDWRTNSPYGFSIGSGDDFAYMTPGVGDALSVKDIGYDLYNRNYKNAAIGAGMLVLPNLLEKPIKSIWRGIKSLRKGAKNKYAINTLEDAMAATDDLWDKDYFKALDDYDLDKAQQLRDLHFKVKAGDKGYYNTTGEPTILYHTIGDQYSPNFNIFDTNIEGRPTYIYATNNKIMSGSYSSRPDDYLDPTGRRKHLYGYKGNTNIEIEGDNNFWYGIEIPVIGKTLEEAREIRKKAVNEATKIFLKERGIPELDTDDYIKSYHELVKHITKKYNNNAVSTQVVMDYLHKMDNPLYNEDSYIVTKTTREIEDFLRKKDIQSAKIKDIIDYGGSLHKYPAHVYRDKNTGRLKTGDVYQFKDSSQLKKKSAKTYDDNGKIIPLSKRDNFNLKDIRYAMPPMLLGLGLYNLGDDENFYREN